MAERLRVVQTLPPQGEPLHLDDAKVHCREESTAADIDITALIAQARQLVEMWSGKQLVCATWKLYLDAFPTEIRVPFPPLREVSSISYVDSNGTTQTLASTEYTVDTNQKPARIVEAYSKSWPVTRDHVNAVTVTFIAGYVVPFTGATSDVCTWKGQNPTDEDSYMLTNSGGTSAALPAGLSANTLYYVRDASGATCKFETSVGGGAVDITDTGTGNHYVGEVPGPLLRAMRLLIGHWYRTREAESVPTDLYSRIRALIAPCKIARF
jgi:uncharacterized phiE125 gp8 family phage protein